ncbi:outer membrane beta-barrel protein [Spiribacter insolitus]|uniref:Outer membrane beta-barrel protein n=1 Tax=Spiribacter insolitus TaxID=3122417 RepID=A0ABV3T673_9GAMM
MMKRKLMFLAIPIAWGLVNAQVSAGMNEAPPPGFHWGLGAAQGYDDNIRQAPSGEEKGSSVTEIAPALGYRAGTPSARYSMRYAPRLRYYSRASDHSRVDHRLSADRYQTLGDAGNLNLSLLARRWTRPVNKNNRVADEQGDIQEVATLGGTYERKIFDGAGSYALGMGYRWNRYANNRTAASSIPGANGSNTQSEDYNSPRLEAMLGWEATETTRLILEGRYVDFRYQWADSSLSSHDTALLAGISWKPSSGVSGRVMAGPLRKDFDSPGLASRTITSWDARLSIRMSQRSRLRFSSRHRFEEGSELGAGRIRQAVTERTTHRAGLSHRLTPRMRLAIGYLNRIKDYRGGVTDGGQNNIRMGFVNVVRALTPDFDLGLELRKKKNDSTFPGASYTRQGVFLTLNWRLQ